MNTKKMYDLPFFSEKLKKIAGQVHDPVIQSELLFVSESLIELSEDKSGNSAREELQRLLGGESPDWWDPNKEDFAT